MPPLGPLGKSRVPLEEDLIKKPIEFVKSWIEFATLNFDQIIRTGFDSGNVKTVLFTVPKNQTLYLTSAWVSSSYSGLTENSAWLQIWSGSGTEFSRALIGNQMIADSNASNSISFISPVVVKSKDQIILNSGASTENIAGFVGFIVPKRIS